ncbi:MAG: hypothetical protein ACKVS5_10665 [Parvularculaceae bacterium]
MPFDTSGGERASFIPKNPALTGITPLAGISFLPARLSAIRLLILAMAAGLGLAVSLAAEPSAGAGADPDLVRLMQAMAILKGLIACALIAAMGWRLTMPTSPARLALYLIAAASMTAGIGLMWRMSHLAEAAVLLHAGLFGAIVLLLRDRTIVARIEQEIARRLARQGREGRELGVLSP